MRWMRSAVADRDSLRRSGDLAEHKPALSRNVWACGLSPDYCIPFGKARLCGRERLTVLTVWRAVCRGAASRRAEAASRDRRGMLN